jgi:SlyX protein
VGGRLAMNPIAESIQRLEEKIAYLERHVTEQDKAMLEMSDDIIRLSRELNALRERTGQDTPGGGGEEAMPDERPPHY